MRRVTGLLFAILFIATPQLFAEPVDVFVAGKDGYFAYRIPSLICTPRGTLLAFCEGRKTSLSDDGNNDLVLRRSTDQGKTWGKLQLVHDEGGDAVITIGNPTAVVDRSNGRVWLAMNRKNHDTLITYSDDDGVSWAPVKDITANVRKSEWGWYALGPGVGIQLERGPKRGRLILPANHRETKDRSGPSASHVIYSDDHGATWHVGGSVGLHTNECQLVETSAGDKHELLINMRNHWARSGKKPELAGRRLVSRSHDAGLTWSEPIRDEALVEPTCQASLLRYSWPGAAERSVLLFANPDHPSKRVRTTVRASFDDGRTWPQSRLIDAGASGYTCMARCGDGRIGLLYERDGYKRITFVDFGLDSLTTTGPESMVWNLDNLKSIGGHPVTVVGKPRVIETDKGKAIEFDGRGDGLFVAANPLAGLKEFTAEVIFRPAGGGPKEQRFLHFQPKDSEDRVLFETRLTPGGQWFLDTYLQTGKGQHTLYAEKFLHPLGSWHHAAIVVDGKTMRHFVDGKEELAADVQLTPLAAGQTSIGVRFNRVFWYQGAIRQIRITPAALKPGAFLAAGSPGP